MTLKDSLTCDEQAVPGNKASNGPKTLQQHAVEWLQRDGPNQSTRRIHARLTSERIDAGAIAIVVRIEFHVDTMGKVTGLTTSRRALRGLDVSAGRLKAGIWPCPSNVRQKLVFAPCYSRLEW